MDLNQQFQLLHCQFQDGATSLVVAKEGEAGATGASQEQQTAPEHEDTDEDEDADEEEVTARVLDKLMEIAIRYPMVRPRSQCVCDFRPFWA